MFAGLAKDVAIMSPGEKELEIIDLTDLREDYDSDPLSKWQSRAGEQPLRTSVSQSGQKIYHLDDSDDDGAQVSSDVAPPQVSNGVQISQADLNSSSYHGNTKARATSSQTPDRKRKLQEIEIVRTSGQPSAETNTNSSTKKNPEETAALNGTLVARLKSPIQLDQHHSADSFSLPKTPVKSPSESFEVPSSSKSFKLPRSWQGTPMKQYKAEVLGIISLHDRARSCHTTPSKTKSKSGRIESIDTVAFTRTTTPSPTPTELQRLHTPVTSPKTNTKPNQTIADNKRTSTTSDQKPPFPMKANMPLSILLKAQTIAAKESASQISSSSSSSSSSGVPGLLDPAPSEVPGPVDSTSSEVSSSVISKSSELPGPIDEYPRDKSPHHRPKVLHSKTTHPLQTIPKNTLYSKTAYTHLVSTNMGAIPSNISTETTLVASGPSEIHEETTPAVENPYDAEENDEHDVDDESSRRGRTKQIPDRLRPAQHCLENLDTSPSKLAPSKSTRSSGIPLLAGLNVAPSRSISEATHDSFTDPKTTQSTELSVAQAVYRLQNRIDEYNTLRSTFISKLLALQRIGPTQVDDRPWIQEYSPFKTQPNSQPRPGNESRVNYIEFLPNPHKKLPTRNVISVVPYDSNAVEVPPYTYYARRKANLLTKNEKALLAFHTDEDIKTFKLSEANRGTLKDIYTHGNPDVRGKAIHHLEMIKQMRPIVEEFLLSLECSVRDVLQLYIDPHERQAKIQDVPNINHLRRRALAEPSIEAVFTNFTEWREITSFLPKSSRPTQENARIACAAVQKVLGMSLWAFFEHDAKQLLSRLQERQPSASAHGAYACRVPDCNIFDCLKHGNFNKLPLEDASAPAEKRPFESNAGTTDSNSDLYVEGKNDPQDHPLGSNFKHRVVSSAYIKHSLSHDKQTSSSQGHSHRIRHLDSNIDVREPAKRSHCSTTCALDKEAMDGQPFTDIEETLRYFNTSERETARSLLPILLKKENGPCLLARLLEKPCSHAAHLIFALKEGFENPVEDTLPASLVKHPASYYKEIAKHADHHEMPPFYPCHHEGTCEVAECSCYVNGVVCEKSCGCAKTCYRRFTGCNCGKSGCWKDANCACWALDRECDADLCTSCGAYDALKPQSRYDDKAKAKFCANVSIQRGLPKRLIMGQSQLSGFGLWAGQSIKENEFLGEYKGELLSNPEAFRRKTLYQHAPREYTFELNLTQELDGTHSGSKIRFINNSIRHKNCRAYPLLVGTVSRIGMFAERDIVAGEEILFEYGYPDDKLEGYKDLAAPVVPVKTKAKNTRSRKAKLDKLKGILTGDPNFEFFAGSSSHDTADTGDDDDDDTTSEPLHPIDEEILQILAKQGNETDDEDYEEVAARGSPAPMTAVDSEGGHHSPSRGIKRKRRNC